jgi:transcriptional regulator with XRE-family HTH domain
MQQVEPKTAEKQEYERFLKALGAQIRAMRKERGWTLRDMVVQHGFHLSAWQGYEAGRLGMSLPSLLRVSKALGLPASALLELVERGSTVPQPATVTARKAPAKVTRKRTPGTKKS